MSEKKKTKKLEKIFDNLAWNIADFCEYFDCGLDGMVFYLRDLSLGELQEIYYLNTHKEPSIDDDESLFAFLNSCKELGIGTKLFESLYKFCLELKADGYEDYQKERK